MASVVANREYLQQLGYLVLNSTRIRESPLVPFIGPFNFLHMQLFCLC